MTAPTQTHPHRTIINGAAVFGGEALARLATFLTAIVVARWFGPVALGEYGYAVAFASLLVIIPDFGLHLFMVRELATTPLRLRQVYWNTHWLKLILASLVVIFALFYGPWGIPDPVRRILFYVLLIRLVLQTFSQASMAVFKAYERMHFVAFQQLVNAAVVVLWVGITMYGHFSLPIVVSGLVAGQLIETLLGWWIIRRHFSPGSPVKWNTAVFRGIMAASVPIGLTAIFQGINLRMDILVLSHFVSGRTLGEFQAAAWFPVGTFLIASLLMAVVFPKLSRLCSGNSAYEIPYVESLIKTGVLVTAVAALLLWFCAPLVIRIVFGRSLIAAADNLKLLAPVLPLVFLNNILFYVFVAARRRDVYLGTLVRGVLAGVALSIWLTSAYGPVGCAIADGARELIISASYLSCLLRRSDTQRMGLALLQVFGGATLVSVLGVCLAATIHHSEKWFAVWVILVLMGTAGFFGLPTRKEWRLLLDDSL